MVSAPAIQQKPLTPEYRQRERRAARPSLEELFADAIDRETRDERIHQAVRVHRYTLSEVGAHVGLLYSTISTIAKKVDERRRRP